MRWKKIAKIASISVLSVAVLGFAGFATLVWNPFEGRHGEIRKAVPFGVDFYVAKANLADDFEDFPQPWFWSDFLASPAYPKIRLGAWYKSATADVTKMVDEIRRVQAELAEIPVLNLRIVDDAIGQDVAIAGKLRSDRDGFDVCAYTRVSWKLRAGYELLGFDFVRSKLRGIALKEEDGIYELRGNADPVYLTRVKDLLIAGTSRDLVQKSLSLTQPDNTGDSIWTSAAYNDLLLSPLEDARRSDNTIELMGDMAAVREWSPAFANWPGTSPDVTQEEKLLRAFLAPKSMRRLWSSVQLDEDTIHILSRLRVDPGELDPFQRRFQDGRGGSVGTWLKPFLRLVPYSAAFAATLRVPPGDFLQACFQTLETDAQNLIEDGMRRAGQRGGLTGMIDQVAPGLEPWVGIVFRNNDYPRYKKEFEVAIPSPAPVWALVLRAGEGGGGRIQDLIRLFKERLRYQLKFEGVDVFINVGPNKEQKIQEWGNRMIPATGQIALLYDDKSRDFIVSNSGKLVREMVNARFRSDGVRPLGQVDAVQRAVDALPQTVSGFAWLNGERALNVVQRYQEFTSKRLQAEAPDQGFLIEQRPGVERAILAREFPGRREASDLRGGDATRFDQLVTDELRRRWSVERERLGRDADKKFREAAAWLETVENASLTLRTRSKMLEIDTRAQLRW